MATGLEGLIMHLDRLATPITYTNSIQQSTRIQISKSFANGRFENGSRSQQWEQRKPWTDIQGRPQPTYKPLSRTGALQKSIRILPFSNQTPGVRLFVPTYRPTGYRRPLTNYENMFDGADERNLMGDIHLFGGFNEKGRAVPSRKFMPTLDVELIPQTEAIISLWDSLTSF